MNTAARHRRKRDTSAGPLHVSQLLPEEQGPIFHLHQAIGYVHARILARGTGRPAADIEAAVRAAVWADHAATLDGLGAGPATRRRAGKLCRLALDHFFRPKQGLNTATPNEECQGR